MTKGDYNKCNEAIIKTENSPKRGLDISKRTIIITDVCENSKLRFWTEIISNVEVHQLSN